MLTYKDCGVDIEAGNELVQRIRKMNPHIGGFAGLFPFGDQYLVAGADGVGTKLKLAFEMNQHETVGIDLVAMCVNDILATGAKPLFFLDYFASSQLEVDQAEAVLKGIVEGCGQADCLLLGGETAELPGFYQSGEYDLSGFAVGAVKKEELVDGTSIKEGDLLVGLPSSGLHSNGFSLVRKIVELSGTPLDQHMDAFGRSLGEELLCPTKIYSKDLLPLLQEQSIKGIVHVTGGGFYENIPRILPDGLGCEIHSQAWTRPPIFDWLACKGNVPRDEMFRTFNMGIGLILVVDPDEWTGKERVIGKVSTSGKVEIL